MSPTVKPQANLHTSVVVGIDAGGTSLRVAIALQATGSSLAQMKAAPAPDGGPETVGLLLETALRAAGVQAENVGAACAGIAKWTRVNIRQQWETELAQLLPGAADIVSVVPDYVIGFHGARNCRARGNRLGGVRRKPAASARAGWRAGVGVGRRGQRDMDNRRGRPPNPPRP